MIIIKVMILKDSSPLTVNLIVYNNTISRITIRINAPAERYTPPPISLSLCLIELTSFRKFFLSDDFNFDLSIAFISFNLSTKVLASAGFELTKDEGAAVVAAFD
jgi:hypothetical protein